MITVVALVCAGSNNRSGESGTRWCPYRHVNLPILLHLILILVSLDVRLGRTVPVISNLEILELVLGFPHLSSQHSDSQPIITTYRVQATATVQSSEYRVKARVQSTVYRIQYRVQDRVQSTC